MGTVSSAFSARHAWHTSLSLGRTEQLPVKGIVFLDLSTPREILRHGILDQPRPNLGIRKPVERRADCPAHRRPVVVIEYAAGAEAAARIEVLHGIRESPGIANDRDGAVAQAVHLIQPARLIA
jgi:hypothetical protein